MSDIIENLDKAQEKQEQAETTSRAEALWEETIVGTLTIFYGVYFNSEF